jgi:hypothetical protein
MATIYNRRFLSYVDLIISKSTENHMYIKFCNKLWETAMKTSQIKKTGFGYVKMSWEQAFKLFNHFKDGQMSIKVTNILDTTHAAKKY